MPELTRRRLLIGGAGAGVVGALGVGGVVGWNQLGSSSPVTASSDAVARAEAARRSAGQKLVTARLTPRPLTADLGGLTVDTWGYGDAVPGPVIRAAAGDLLRITVDNELPTETSVHWHGLALRNDMDGVPGMTQDPIPAGGRFTYEFTAPDPGTYFYHPHTGVQLDRGLYGALVIDDPAEPGDYDAEWIVLLDDWVDGTGRTPDQVLEQLLAGGMDHGGMAMGGMGGMGGMGEGMQSALLGGAGDVDYPHYLVNGRTPEAPATLTAEPGQRVRIRFVNAGSDTAFRVALGGHRMTVTHSDGFPVRPAETDALLIGMGERYDVLVTVGDGAFPLAAAAEGKQGRGLAIARTGKGGRPGTDRPAELDRRILTGADLAALEDVRLSSKRPDRTHRVAIAGAMAPYRWTINGRPFPDAESLPVTEGERVRLRFENHSMMFHPMHLHGHTFGLTRGGARKDTVIVRPMQTVEVELDADNPGQWATHCHNIYHAEAGMMTALSYQA